MKTEIQPSETVPREDRRPVLTMPAPSLTVKQIKLNQVAYIFEAGFEYFISILITDAFLATLLKRTGFTDAQSGIITQIASFALVAQLLSVFVRKNKGMKPWLTGLHLINQVMFFMLYGMNFLDIPADVKKLLFVVLYLGGYLIANIISPYKLPWMMSFVSDNKRGVYTAIKEMTNLVAGMALSFIMGSVVDHFNALGTANPDMRVLGFAPDDFSLLICGVSLLVFMIFHTVSILVMKDRTREEIETSTPQTGSIGIKDALRRTFGNQALVKLIFIDIMWQAANGIATAFYGVYKINELGFTLRYISIISIVGAVGRLVFSLWFASIADKRSWTTMLSICIVIATLGFGVNIFTTPSNGKVMFMVYSVINSIAMAGLNSGLWNILFDFVPASDRAAGLGINNTFGGITALIASLVGSAILSHIQGNGNMLFGFHVYAQQVLSAIAFVILIGLCIYMRAVIAKMKKHTDF